MAYDKIAQMPPVVWTSFLAVARGSKSPPAPSRPLEQRRSSGERTHFASFKQFIGECGAGLCEYFSPQQCAVKTLNRAAVVVTPKQEFLDWLRGLDESNRKLTMADLCEDACAKIFEQELESWDRLEETWPIDRSFEAFRQWFDYSIHGMVFDLARGRLKVEEI